MTKILNVDALQDEVRMITLNGVSHQMKELSVGDFIKITKLEDEAEKKGELSFADRVDFLVKYICLVFPTCTNEELYDCDFQKINALFAFAKDGTLPEGVNQKEEEEEDSSKKN